MCLFDLFVVFVIILGVIRVRLLVGWLMGFVELVCFVFMLFDFCGFCLVGLCALRLCLLVGLLVDCFVRFAGLWWLLVWADCGLF